MKVQQIQVGWEEWVSLPELGLPALKVKVDTGAKTSSIHAFSIQPYGEKQKRVRFGIQPIPENPDFYLYCDAELVDMRDVTSSNGESEKRYIIKTKVKFGPWEGEIEVSLANRESMAYKMLLGRNALKENIIVAPEASFLLGDMSYDVYKSPRYGAKVNPTPLKIAILTREPENYSSQRLKEAGQARGHEVHLINTARCYMRIDHNAPDVFWDGVSLKDFDAVIPRIGASQTFYGMAVVRQFQMMGIYCVNSADAIGSSRDKLLSHQLLAAKNIPMPSTGFANSPRDTKALIDLVQGAPMVLKLLEGSQGKGVVLAETKKAAESVIGAFQNLKANFLVQNFVKESAGEDIRCFVVDNKVVATMKRTGAPGEFRSNLHQGGEASRVKITKKEREVALKSVKAMGLKVAGVDMLRSEVGPKVIEVNSSPGLEGVEKISKVDIAGKILEFIEKKLSAKSAILSLKTKDSANHSVKSPEAKSQVKATG